MQKNQFYWGGCCIISATFWGHAKKSILLERLSDHIRNVLGPCKNKPILLELVLYSSRVLNHISNVLGPCKKINSTGEAVASYQQRSEAMQENQFYWRGCCIISATVFAAFDGRAIPCDVSRVCPQLRYIQTNIRRVQCLCITSAHNVRWNNSMRHFWEAGIRLIDFGGVARNSCT